MRLPFWPSLQMGAFRWGKVSRRPRKPYRLLGQASSSAGSVSRRHYHGPGLASVTSSFGILPAISSGRVMAAGSLLFIIIIRLLPTSQRKGKMSFSPEQVAAGHAVYTKRMLTVYDFVVLVISNRLIWKCPSRRILELYNRHVTGNHLHVGVGTGYFLARCRFPS